MADHLDPQHIDMRQAFAHRRRNTVIAMIVMLPSGFFVGFTVAAGTEGMAALGIPLLIWLPLAGVIFAGSILVAAISWRCPHSGASLPRLAQPTRCAACGATLQEPPQRG